jgi:predicted acyltransferase
MSTVGALITTFMGYHFSLIMGRYKQFPNKLILNWIAISVVFGVLVYPMTLLMPLNKKLYSASFTLIVIAVSGASLSFFYLVVDILPDTIPQSKKVIQTISAPLKWLGLNPLAIFVLMTLVTIFMRNYFFIDDSNLWTYFFK